MTLTSTRDERADGFHPPVKATGVAGFFVRRASWLRGSRFEAAVYVAIAVAAPFLMYAGPDVLSPAAPTIADHAADGTFSLGLHGALHR